MNVIPIASALNSDSGQKYKKQRNNPSFGLQLTPEAEVIIDYLRSELIKIPQKTHQQKVASKMVAIVDALLAKTTDKFKLDIQRVQKDGKEKLKLTLEKTDETFEGKPLQAVKFCRKQSFRIAQVLSEFFLDNNGKILNQLAMAARIRDEKSGLSKVVNIRDLAVILTPSPKTARVGS